MISRWLAAFSLIGSVLIESVVGFASSSPGGIGRSSGQQSTQKPLAFFAEGVLPVDPDGKGISRVTKTVTWEGSFASSKIKFVSVLIAWRPAIRYWRFQRTIASGSFQDMLRSGYRNEAFAGSLGDIGQVTKQDGFVGFFYRRNNLPVPTGSYPQNSESALNRGRRWH